MLNLIFGYAFIHSIMLCMRFGLVLAGFFVASPEARSEDEIALHDLDIVKVQVVPDADGLFPYHINAKFVLARAKDTVQAGAEFSATPQMSLVAEPKKEAAWATGSNWKVTPGSDRARLSPSLRFESKGVRIEIKPRLHSIWFLWRKSVNF